MPRSELVVATGTYDGGPSAPTARSSVADGGFMSSRVALRPVRAVGAEGPPSYVPVATSSSLRDMLPAAPPRPLADYVWFSAYRGENFI